MPASTPSSITSTLEICVDSVASARAAAAGGADRVELCANLPEGGTTPSAGMIRAVRSVFPGALMVIIRPRGYDFLYSEDELTVMQHDIAIACDAGADGVVLGCLTPEGRVDAQRCKQLLAVAGSLDVTFHRAFDMATDLGEALETLVDLGIRRVLTSGGQPDVPAGVSRIADLVRQARGRISIMPGGGVTAENLASVVEATGVQEIHLSARDRVSSRMRYRNQTCGMGIYSGHNEYEWREASADKVRVAKTALTEACRELQAPSRGTSGRALGP